MNFSKIIGQAESHNFCLLQLKQECIPDNLDSDRQQIKIFSRLAIWHFWV